MAKCTEAPVDFWVWSKGPGIESWHGEFGSGKKTFPTKSKAYLDEARNVAVLQSFKSNVSLAVIQSTTLIANTILELTVSAEEPR